MRKILYRRCLLRLWGVRGSIPGGTKRNRGREAYQAGKQRQQHRQGIDKEGGTVPCQKRDEADELNGVAKPVIAADQHASIVERCAVPDLLEVTGHRGIVGGAAAAPNPVADLPCARKLASSREAIPCNSVRVISTGCVGHA